jgi:ATP-binding cassette subfamily B protein
MLPGGGRADEDAPGKAYDSRLVRRLLPHVRPHGRLLALSLAFLVLLSGAQLVQPYVLMLVIDGPIARGDPGGLLPLSLLYAASAVLEFAARFGQMYSMELTGQRVILGLRSTLYRHLQRLPASFFDRMPAGRLVTRLTSDVENLSEVFSSGIVTLLGDSVKLVGIVAILFLMDVRLAAATLLVLPALAGLAFFFRVKIRDAFRSVRERVARLNAFLQEQVTGVAVIQLFQRERENDAEFEEVNRRHRDADLASVVWDSVFSALIELFGSLTVAGILWYGGARVVSGVVTFGTLVAFVEYVQKFFGPIRELGGYYSVLQSAMASSERIFALLDEAPEGGIPPGPAPPGAAPGPAAGAGALAFRGVHFAYGDGRDVLAGLDLEVRPGEKVALVGSTGAGKTTLARLLLRLYEPRRGAVEIDGRDVREIPLADLRRRIGVVLQEPFLFAGSVAANVSLGDPSIPRGRIEAAARAVGAHAFIEALPGGYDAEVKQAGANLSTGQKQLLCFARVLAFDPPVLLLDEATSSIDSATERVVHEAFLRLTRGRTCLVIAHRLSTVRDCDRIVVLHGGRVREEGRHEELVRRGGIYAAFVQLQTSPLGAAI